MKMNRASLAPLFAVAAVALVASTALASESAYGSKKRTRCISEARTAGCLSYVRDEHTGILAAASSATATCVTGANTASAISKATRNSATVSSKVVGNGSAKSGPNRLDTASASDTLDVGFTYSGTSMTITPRGSIKFSVPTTTTEESDVVLTIGAFADSSTAIADSLGFGVGAYPGGFGKLVYDGQNLTPFGFISASDYSVVTAAGVTTVTFNAVSYNVANVDSANAGVAVGADPAARTGVPGMSPALLFALLALMLGAGAAVMLKAKPVAQA